MTAPASVSAVAVAASLSGVVRPEKAGDPEVEEASDLSARQHDVLGLDVAVEDAGRVGVVERLEQGTRHHECLGQRKRATAQAVPEGLARNVLHREERDPVGLAGLVERRDRGMLEAGAGFGFAPKPRRQLGRHGLGDDLQRRRPSESEVAGEEHLSHSTSA